MEESYRGRFSDLREEFRLKKFGFHHERPTLFVNAQFFGPTVYLVWTIFWLVFYVTMFILDHTYYNYSQGDTWIIYLTNWSYVVQTATVLLECLVTVFVYWKRTDIRDGTCSDTPWYIKFLWVWFTVSNTASVLITLLYYILLDADFSHPSVNKHLLNSVYTVLNLLFCSKPVQLLHFYQPMIYAIAYVIFSVIYHVAGGGVIYDPLNWNKAGNATLLSVLAAFIGVPLVHLFCFALFTLRVFIYSKGNSSKKLENDKNNIHREVTAQEVQVVVTPPMDNDRSSTHAQGGLRPGSRVSHSSQIP